MGGKRIHGLDSIRAQGWLPQRETAIGTFILWLDAWAAESWEGMASLCQLTARLSYETLGGWLKSVYGTYILVDAEIEDIVEVSPVCVDINAKLCCLDDKREQHTSFVTARIIRESGLRQPSETGEWGVNPLAAMRGLFR
jgi:hypothetical protein